MVSQVHSSVSQPHKYWIIQNCIVCLYNAISHFVLLLFLLLIGNSHFFFHEIYIYTFIYCFYGILSSCWFSAFPLIFRTYVSNVTLEYCNIQNSSAHLQNSSLKKILFWCSQTAKFSFYIMWVFICLRNFLSYFIFGVYFSFRF